MTNSQHPSSEVNDAEVTGLLRQSAPDLSANLRSRTLANCTARAETQRRRQNRLNWQLTCAILGVLTLQAVTVSVLDAQNTQLISGNSPSPMFASLSLSEFNQLWHQRSRQLAGLMQSTKVG